MISGWTLLLVSLTYVSLLFAIAWWGDRTRIYPERPRLRAIIYSLALAAYCSSWTFYGAAGSASRSGLMYLSIYLGPILFFTCALPFFLRLVRQAKRQNATSISDLLAARFGRSSRIAVLVTTIALMAAIPYIALQLKAIAMSIEVLTQTSPAPLDRVWYQDSTFYVALLLAVFACLFGTRAANATEHHPGIVLAVAAESLVKLIALGAVAIFAVVWLGGWQPVLDTARTLPSSVVHPVSFLAQTLISLTAIFCLPRQFQLGVVECAATADVKQARWWFSGYLGLISLMVIPIIATAPGVLGAGGGPPDALVLTLPLLGESQWLALFAYLGGLSAGTGMVIVASVALATMVSNDLVLPALLRIPRLTFVRGIGLLSRPSGEQRFEHPVRPELSRRVAARSPPAAAGHIPVPVTFMSARLTTSALLLWIRRFAILGVLLCAYGFFCAVHSTSSLASIGLLAFAAVAQFAPALVAAVYWPGASRRGVITGLFAGFALWSYTLLLPELVSHGGGAHAAWLREGLLGYGILAPLNLFAMEFTDPLTHGVFWSLLANVSGLIFVSLRHPPSMTERLEASDQLAADDAHEQAAKQLLPGAARVGDLLQLAQRLLGAEAAEKLANRYAHEQGRELILTARADVGLLRRLEREIAGILGGNSARMVLTSALHGAGFGLAEVLTVFDAATQNARLNREMLGAVMENVPHGICVADSEMRLVAWNQTYLDLFQYPPGMVYSGVPIADLIRFHVARNGLPGDPEEHVQRHFAAVAQRLPDQLERRLANGRIIEVRGQPMPQNGYCWTISDVTAYKRAAENLQVMNETLEQRVAERTEQLAQATLAAQQANSSKTRFFTAATHDLLQPLNAAILFNGALQDKVQHQTELRSLVERVERSLGTAKELLDSLLDISRLDAGGLRLEQSTFAITSLLDSIEEQYAPIALQRGIELELVSTSAYLHTDKRLLRQVIQNFVSNALRYTKRGRVVIGCRRRAGGEIEIQVLDTGPGIEAAHREAVFEEFHRLEQHSPWGEQGLGLGLSICKRIAVLLEAELKLTSVAGRGSTFGIRLPAARGAVSTERSASRLITRNLRGTRVLCLDDDPGILEGIEELLRGWGIEVICTSTLDAASTAMRNDPIDVLLIDYHLSGKSMGLEVIESLVRYLRPRGLKGAALITGDNDPELESLVRAAGIHLLRKPLRPAALRAFICARMQLVVTASATGVSSSSVAN